MTNKNKSFESLEFVSKNSILDWAQNKSSILDSQNNQNAYETVVS